MACRDQKSTGIWPQAGLLSSSHTLIRQLKHHQKHYTGFLEAAWTLGTSATLTTKGLHQPCADSRMQQLATADVQHHANSPPSPSQTAMHGRARSGASPAYMATKVIHMVITGEMASWAGMVMAPFPSKGMSMVKVCFWEPACCPVSEPRPAPSPAGRQGTPEQTKLLYCTLPCTLFLW